jgi:serum/glucocorticoid-regulated kinase 2
MFYIWESNEHSLKEQVTTKQHKKRGMSMIPRKETATNYANAASTASPPRQSSQGDEEEKSVNRGGRSTTIFAKGQDTTTVTLDDFKVLKVIGRGSFGKVMLVEKLDTHAIYAMKSLRKDALIEKDQIEHTRTEKMVMEHVNHPFLTNLEFAFSTPDKIFFVM